MGTRSHDFVPRFARHEHCGKFAYVPPVASYTQVPVMNNAQLPVPMESPAPVLSNAGLSVGNVVSEVRIRTSVPALKLGSAPVPAKEGELMNRELFRYPHQPQSY